MSTNLNATKMKISDKGLQELKLSEGLRLDAYQCSAGTNTIGFGSTYVPPGFEGFTNPYYNNQNTTQKVQPDMRLKDDVAALELLRVTLDDFEAAVNDNVTVKINQNQYDALVCFVFNIGVQAFKDSTLLRLLNEAKYYLAAEQFKRWCKETVNGKLVVNQGLENRRLREANLFCSP